MAERTLERKSSLVETHKGYDPRLLTFYPILAALLLTLVGGLAYQQFLKAELYHQQERQQNQRRILMPGPRGNIYDRHGRLLVGNRARFAATLYLDELRSEFWREYLRVRKNYRDLEDKDVPNAAQLKLIARYSVVQRYLDLVNRALGRAEKVDAELLNRHFAKDVLLPFVLLDDLSQDECAKLLEQLKVQSPLQVQATSTRYYPYKSAAAHTLGNVRADDDLEIESTFPGAELRTFKMRGGIEGATGLERSFEDTLRGQTGGSIYRVDPHGFRIEPALSKQLPVQGKDVITTLDIDIQLAAEAALMKTEMAGAAVLMDVNTGEVLAIVSKPDFDLNTTSPRIKSAVFKEINEKGGWLHRAVQGVYPPGSSFKILMSVAGARNKVVRGESAVDCPGFYMVGKTSSFPCHDNHAHGHVDLPTAIHKSCNVFFYHYGLMMGPQAIADEARRFGFGEKTGVELPFETGATIVPDPAWKKKRFDDAWRDGDTANYSIGQGALRVTPLQMASFTASFARGETKTRPTLVRVKPGFRQVSEKIGLSADDYSAIIEGMEECVSVLGGTAHKVLGKPPYGPFPFRIGAKTGTAQQKVMKDGVLGTINFAWMIAFAPIEKPEIAMAICVEGDTLNEETAGGVYAGPVAAAMFKAWWAKRNQPPTRPAD